MGKFIDLTGQKFGRLTVLERAENKGRTTMWFCKCECGNQTNVCGNDLKRGRTISCGCYRSEKTTKHGHFNERIYDIWRGIKRRCHNKNCRGYSIYGGRGIMICEEWSDNFQAFYDWSIQNGYSDDLTIDRIDVNGNYEPKNCRWITKKEQSYNRRNSHFITYNGKTQTLAQWADEYNMSYNKLSSRINDLHWTIEKALNTP